MPLCYGTTTTGSLTGLSFYPVLAALARLQCPGTTPQAKGLGFAEVRCPAPCYVENGTVLGKGRVAVIWVISGRVVTRSANVDS